MVCVLTMATPMRAYVPLAILDQRVNQVSVGDKPGSNITYEVFKLINKYDSIYICIIIMQSCQCHSIITRSDHAI